MRGGFRLAVLLLLSAAALLVAGRDLHALQQSPGPLRGEVRTRDGAPVAGANVFLLETLEGTLSDSSGRFVLATAAARPYTLLVRRVGFLPIQRLLTAADSGMLVLTLERGVTTLAPVSVQAGVYTADEERGATLTPLQVVTTPGAAADITRAIQSLPGVQQTDEGNALFVRGGDYTETRIFLNDAPLLNPQQLQTPTGTFTGTVDPFQLDGIFFSSGGFGARYGNALSGVAGLRTRGTTPAPAATISVGLAALSADVAIPVTNTFTVRAAANRFDLAPLFTVNGATRAFSPPPRGRDLSTSATWRYRPSGELKLFAIDQTNLVGVDVDDPAGTSTFNSEDRTRLAVLSWRDVVGRWASTVSASHTDQTTAQRFGDFTLGGRTQQSMLFAQVEFSATNALLWRTGGEIEQLNAALNGSLPRAVDSTTGAPVRLFDHDRAATRVGPFTEVDWRLTNSARVIAGLRADRSQLTDAWTADPRLSLAWKPGLATFTAAWGIYHQVASPLQYDDAIGDPSLPAMRAEQRVLGVQLGEGDLQFRVEAYDKRYRDLVQLRRDNTALGGGIGSARGVDVFFKGALPGGFTTRTTVSALRAQRTDPNTGVLARAPFDITTSATTIVERVFGGVHAAVAWRRATGRAYTDIIGADYDAVEDRYTPRFGTPFSERLPSFRRLDISASWYRVLTPHWRSVLFVSVNNILDRSNVQIMTWSRDYTERIPVRSIFNRSVYFGGTLIRQ